MIDPKHIMITGASSGIGAALALEYAAPGVRLALLGRDLSRLGAIAEQAVQKGATVAAYVCDVTEADKVAALIDSVDESAPLDLVIANAGISGGTSGEGESPGQVDAIFAVNVGGVFNTIHPALAAMKKRRRGQVAIISSLAGFRGLPGAPAYCASKAAVRIYGEGLRGEMAGHNVGVSVVCPGFIKTPMTDINPFHMPFLMSAQRAARIIRTGLACNKARIAFPLIMYLLVRFMASLPPQIVDAVFARVPGKRSLEKA